MFLPYKLAMYLGRRYRPPLIAIFLCLTRGEHHLRPLPTICANQKKKRRRLRNAFANSSASEPKNSIPLLFAHPRLSCSRVLTQERPDATASPDEIEAAPIEGVDARPRLREPHAFQRNLSIAPSKKKQWFHCIVKYQVTRKPQPDQLENLPPCLPACLGLPASRRASQQYLRLGLAFGQHA